MKIELGDLTPLVRIIRHFIEMLMLFVLPSLWTFRDEMPSSDVRSAPMTDFILRLIRSVFAGPQRDELLIPVRVEEKRDLLKRR